MTVDLCEYQKAYRAAHPEKHRAASNAWYARHREEVNAKVCAKRAAIRAADPDKARALSKARYAANAEKQREAHRLHRLAHSDELREREHKYLLAHPENVMWKSAKSRAREKHLPFDIEVSDIRVPAVCPVLGIPLVHNDKQGPAPSSPSLDRIRPELGYVKGNVRVISHRANALLMNSTLEEARLIYEDRKRTHGSKP